MVSCILGPIRTEGQYPKDVTKQTTTSEIPTFGNTGFFIRPIRTSTLSTTTTTSKFNKN